MRVQQSAPRVDLTDLGIRSVLRGCYEQDPRAYEVCWDNWPIFSKVRAEDVLLLEALIAIRVRKLQKNNRIIANFTPRT